VRAGAAAAGASVDVSSDFLPSYEEEKPQKRQKFSS
jgi:hypothetical protein